VFCTENEEEFEGLMKEICGTKKPTVCIESVSGPMTGQVMKHLHTGGTMIMYGALSGKPIEGVTVGLLLTKNLKIESFWLSNWIPQ